jgi:hypothetical protein
MISGAARFALVVPLDCNHGVELVSRAGHPVSQVRSVMKACRHLARKEARHLRP